MYVIIWGLQNIVYDHMISDFTKMKTPIQKPPADPLESMKAPLKPPPIDPKEAIKGHQAGDGIRSMEVLIGFSTSTFDIISFRPPVCSERWILSCMWSQTSTLWLSVSPPSAVALATLLIWSINTESRDFIQQLMTMTKCTSQRRDQNGISLKKYYVYSLDNFTEWTMSQLVPPVVLKASKKHTGKKLQLVAPWLSLIFSNTCISAWFGWHRIWVGRRSQHNQTRLSQGELQQSQRIGWYGKAE